MSAVKWLNGFDSPGWQPALKNGERLWRFNMPFSDGVREVWTLKPQENLLGEPKPVLARFRWQALLVAREERRRRISSQWREVDTGKRVA